MAVWGCLGWRTLGRFTGKVLEKDGEIMVQYLEKPKSLITCLTRRLTVRHRDGLHARPSAAIAKTVSHFQTEVLIHYGNQQADARGIFDIMMLCVPEGADVVFEANGPDAKPALEALSNLFAADFALSEN